MRLLLATAAAAAIITLAVTLGTQALRRRYQPTCTTCGTRSNWRVAGHTDRECKEFVQEQLRRAKAHAEAVGRPAPDPAWPYSH